VYTTLKMVVVANNATPPETPQQYGHSRFAPEAADRKAQIIP
jgi:hypothetical protein